MLLRPWDSPGKNTGAGCHSLLQGIFPTQGSNLDLPHGRHVLYRLSHREAILEVLSLVIPLIYQFSNDNREFALIFLNKQLLAISVIIFLQGSQHSNLECFYKTFDILAK